MNHLERNTRYEDFENYVSLCIFAFENLELLSRKVNSSNKITNLYLKRDKRIIILIKFKTRDFWM